MTDKADPFESTRLTASDEAEQTRIGGMPAGSGGATPPGPMWTGPASSGGAAPPPPPVSSEILLQPGAVLNNSQRIEALIGRGGMGEVYRATNVHTGDQDAIKVIRPDLASDPQIRELFRREAGALRKVRHPAVVSYQGVFGDDSGRVFLVMDFVNGPSLASLIAKAPLAPADVRRVGVQIAEGLAAAHACGVVHRDLSPDNVVLRGGDIDQPVLIDFGVAKRLDGGTAVGTAIGTGFVGKLAYCSPEQCGLYDANVDQRTDVYSLGLLLAAAAVGRPLPMGSSMAHAVKARESRPDLSAVPEELRADLTRLLEPDPARRAQTMREVAALLSYGAAPSAPRPVRTGSPLRPVAWIAGGTAVVILLVGTGVLVGPRLMAALGGDMGANQNQDAEAERLAAEDARRKAEDERIAAEARRQADGEGQRREEERAAAEKARQDEDARRAATVEAERRQAEEAARRQTEADRQAADEARRKADAERLAREDAQRKAEGERRAADEARRKAEAERLAAEETQRRAEADRRAAEDARRKAETDRLALEESQRRAEADRRAAEEAQRKAEADRRGGEEARRRAEDEARRQEADRVAAERRRVDEEAQRQSGEESRRRAEEAQRRADEERRAAEAQRRADEERRTAEARGRAEEERRAAAEAQRKADEERRRQEALAPPQPPRKPPQVTAKPPVAAPPATAEGAWRGTICFRRLALTSGNETCGPLSLSVAGGTANGTWVVNGLTYGIHGAVGAEGGRVTLDMPPTGQGSSLGAKFTLPIRSTGAALQGEGYTINSVLVRFSAGR